MVTVAAALLTAAALAGCGLVQEEPEAIPATPPPAAATPPVVAPPADAERPPLSPPVEVPMPSVPTVHGPYVPPTPQPEASATPDAAPSATPETTPSPTAEPRSLVALLPVARELPPLTWTSADGEHTATWSELTPAAAVAPARAIAPVAAARASGDACAAAAEAVDGAALEAAGVSLAAGRAPGAPFDVVLVRYPTAEAAELARAALQRLGTDCAGVVTDEGVLEAGEGAHGPTVVLRTGEAALVAESAVIDALLAVVLHEGAPPEAVATLLAATR